MPVSDADIAALAADLVKTGVAVAFGVTGSGASSKLIAGLEAAGARYLPASHEASASCTTIRCLAAVSRQNSSKES